MVGEKGGCAREVCCGGLVGRRKSMPGRAVGGGPGSGIPATHVGDLVGAPGSWLQVGPAMTVVAITEMNQYMRDSFSPLSHSLRINQSIFLTKQPMITSCAPWNSLIFHMEIATKHQIPA